MPYAIQQEGRGKWTVRKADGSGGTLGTHPSKAHAEAQVRAIYANESKKKKKAASEEGEPVKDREKGEK